ncbi:MAG TPA: NAD(P)/FAD-dependent oxidoreductase [Caulobacteraceae bacterium]|jgi:L-2-hydroxyglutarate oxidase LhgO|nr:NAD(P)/FAD-dependent oxidoreductase [Caulobacteraceae bacterium]
MIPFDVDVTVVGAGAVGLACGYALARRGRSVVVLEKEGLIGQGISSRNSEVIHAGLYYPTGSLKARLCVEGRRSLYGFLEAHKVPHEKCGKLVVAPHADDVEKIEAIARQAGINGVENVSLITADQARAREPEIRCEMALLSQETGIFEAHGYMLALEGEIEDAGGAIARAAPFQGAMPLDGGGFEVRAGGAEPSTLRTRELVISAGLGAQACAEAIEGFPRALIPRLHYGKGSYFALAGKPPFSMLVYPPPIHGALGLHYKRDLGSRAHFGPDLEWVEQPNYDVDPSRAGYFYDRVRSFWPSLPDGALSPDFAGIRPKLHGPDEPQPDFDICDAKAHGLEGLIALFGIESPGLTSSLAIGEEVAKRLSA